MYSNLIASTDEQLHLCTLKDSKCTFNLAQWLITNRKSIAQYDNQLRIRDIQ